MGYNIVMIECQNCEIKPSTRSVKGYYGWVRVCEKSECGNAMIQLQKNCKMVADLSELSKKSNILWLEIKENRKFYKAVYVEPKNYKVVYKMIGKHMTHGERLALRGKNPIHYDRILKEMRSNTLS